METLKGADYESIRLAGVAPAWVQRLQTLQVCHPNTKPHPLHLEMALVFSYVCLLYLPVSANEMTLPLTLFLVVLLLQ